MGELDSTIGSDDRRDIIMRPANRLTTGLLMSCMLAVCVAGESTFANGLALGDVRNAPVVLTAFVVVWLAIDALLVLAVVWIAAGAEVISIEEKILTKDRKIGPFRIWRRESYFIGRIEDMWIEERRYGAKGKAFMKYAIV